MSALPSILTAPVETVIAALIEHKYGTKLDLSAVEMSYSFPNAFLLGVQILPTKDRVYFGHNDVVIARARLSTYFPNDVYYPEADGFTVSDLLTFLRKSYGINLTARDVADVIYTPSPTYVELQVSRFSPLWEGGDRIRIYKPQF